ncbi:hypothetical protein C0992_010975 [Termitomyces sp. T32_za158]|nr:hypothetical protein C0992_010975 [Termitomyces sp. T32_za158]
MTAEDPRLTPALVNGQVYKIVSAESGQVMTLGSITSTGTFEKESMSTLLTNILNINWYASVSVSSNLANVDNQRCVDRQWVAHKTENDWWTLRSRHISSESGKVYLDYDGRQTGARLCGTPNERKWELEQSPAGAEYK